MKVVVTGGRDFSDREILFAELDAIHIEHAVTRIAAGCATGADAIAISWARERRVDRCVYKANWFKFGKSAGPRRNRLMLETEQPDLVVAFPGGAGTADCVRQAKFLGLKVIEVNQ